MFIVIYSSCFGKIVDNVTEITMTRLLAATLDCQQRGTTTSHYPSVYVSNFIFKITCVCIINVANTDSTAATPMPNVVRKPIGSVDHPSSRVVARRFSRSDRRVRLFARPSRVFAFVFISSTIFFNTVRSPPHITSVTIETKSPKPIGHQKRHACRSV